MNECMKGLQGRSADEDDGCTFPHLPSRVYGNSVLFRIYPLGFMVTLRLVNLHYEAIRGLLLFDAWC